MKVTASSLKRFIECPASSILPRVTEDAGEAADRGTDIHGYLDRVACGVSVDDAIKLVPDEYRNTCLDIDVEELLKYRTRIRTEVAYALDPISRQARILGNHLGRNYVISDNEIAGSEDLVAELEELPGTIEVSDYKTGDNVGPAQENTQLFFFAACEYLLSRESVPEVRGRIIYINDDGSHSIDEAVFTVFDIEDYLATLADAVRRYNVALNEFKESRINVKTGDHCVYCPALQSCPAYTSLARRLVPELEAIEDLIATLTPQQAGKAWAMKKQIGAIYKKVDDGLKAYAESYGIELENGKVVSAGTFTKSYFSQDEAIKMLQDKGASKSEIASLYRSKKITAIRERNRKE